MSRTVLITGAAGNLGKEVVSLLHKQGYRIIATIIEPQAPDYFSEMGVESHTLNLLDEEAVTQWAETLATAHPELDAFIALAGGYTPGDLAQTSGAAIDKMINLNFKTVFFLTKALFPHFERAASGGQFVYIGARPAMQAADGIHNMAYALSKSLIFRLSEQINAMGHGKKISATTIVPSTIDTALNRSSMPDADFSSWVKAGHLAESIAFVLSDAGRNLRQSVLQMYNEA